VKWISNGSSAVSYESYESSESPVEYGVYEVYESPVEYGDPSRMYKLQLIIADVANACIAALCAACTARVLTTCALWHLQVFCRRCTARIRSRMCLQRFCMMHAALVFFFFFFFRF